MSKKPSYSLEGTDDIANAMKEQHNPNDYDDFMNELLSGSSGDSSSLDTPAYDNSNESAVEETEQRIKAMYPADEYDVDLYLDDLVPAPIDWNFFSKPSEDQLRALEYDIFQHGQMHAIIAWQQEDGKYLVLGGNTRLLAFRDIAKKAQESGHKEIADDFSTIRANIYAKDSLNEIEARKIIITDNTVRRENTPQLKTRSVVTMHNLIAESRDKHRPDRKRAKISETIAAYFGDSARSIAYSYKLRNLAEGFWPLINDKVITMKYAHALSNMPIVLQNYILENKLYEKKKLSGKELQKLSEMQSMDGVDSIYSSPRVYTARAKREIDEPIPSGYKTLILAGTPGELKRIKAAIQEAYENGMKLSDKTKTLLDKLLAE